MTALDKYAKLEAEARYFDGFHAEPSDVIVSFGERTLIIMGLDDRIIAHWPLASLRALDVGANRTAQLTPSLESEERLLLSDREMLDAIAAVCPDLAEPPAQRHLVRRTLIWGGAALASLALIVFVLVPNLAGHLATQIPAGKAELLGDAILSTLPEAIGPERPSDPPPKFCVADEGSRALARMVARLAPHATVPYDLKVQVMDHGLVNAFALPGGRVVLFRGLIERARAPEEVAGVLAHEIGHVVARDPLRGVLRAAGTTGVVGLLMGDVFGASIVTAGSEAALTASYQREAETRADEIAYEILRGAGLPSRPFAAFFGRMEAQAGDAGGLLRIVSTHPSLGGRSERAAAADTIGSGSFTPVLRDRDWLALRRICTRTGPAR